MDKIFIVTAATGEYEDNCSYNLFACASKEDADICLRAIDNWFQLQGHGRTVVDKYHYVPVDYSENGINRGRHDCEEAFEEQFGVGIRIGYTGIEFDVEQVKVFRVQQGT